MLAPQGAAPVRRMRQGRDASSRLVRERPRIMKLVKADPSGYERSAAFVTRARGCGLEDVRSPMYAVSARAGALRTLRKVARLGLRDAAIELGVSAIELSSLERGRMVPEDENEWLKMLETLERRARDKR